MSSMVPSVSKSHAMVVPTWALEKKFTGEPTAVTSTSWMKSKSTESTLM